MTEQVTSARANFIAFTSAFTGAMSPPFTGLRCAAGARAGATADHRQPLLARLEIFFKMLVDGEAI